MLTLVKTALQVINHDLLNATCMAHGIFLIALNGTNLDVEIIKDIAE